MTKSLSRSHLKIVDTQTTRSDLVPLAQATVYQPAEYNPRQPVASNSFPLQPLIVGFGLTAMACTLIGYMIATNSQNSALIQTKADLQQIRGNLKTVQGLICP